MAATKLAHRALLCIVVHSTSPLCQSKSFVRLLTKRATQLSLAQWTSSIVRCNDDDDGDDENGISNALMRDFLLLMAVHTHTISLSFSVFRRYLVRFFAILLLVFVFVFRLIRIWNYVRCSVNGINIIALLVLIFMPNEVSVTSNKWFGCCCTILCLALLCAYLLKKSVVRK